MENDTRQPARRSQFFAQLEEDRKMLRAIHGALIGDGLGNPGLVKRIEVVETAVETKAAQTEVTTIAAKVEGHDRKIWFVLTAASGAWAIVVAFKEKLFGH